MLLLLSLTACSGQQSAVRVCTIANGAKAQTPLTLEAWFPLSTCAMTQDAQCQAFVDGGAIVFETSATVCPQGLNPPGGAFTRVSCVVPPLASGTYELLPFGTALEVLADGGGLTSCP
jgi:hypothetical protein